MGPTERYPWIADAFQDVRKEGELYASAACPLRCHTMARVRFWLGAGDRLLLRCMHPECNALEVLRAVGRSWRDCFPDAKVPEKTRRNIVARYQYRDEMGDVLYEMCRFEPGFTGGDKSLRPYCRGEWRLPQDVRRVLYRLPALLALPGASRIYVVGGEKDCESLVRIGCEATTNVLGEGSRWLDSYSQVLARFDVVVIPDADSTGVRHADEVVGSLVRHGAKVRLGKLPAKDATAYINGLRVSGITDPAELRTAFEKEIAA